MLLEVELTHSRIRTKLNVKSVSYKKYVYVSVTSNSFVCMWYPTSDRLQAGNTNRIWQRYGFFFFATKSELAKGLGAEANAPI
jgi:hypothetical protein